MAKNKEISVGDYIVRTDEKGKPKVYHTADPNTPLDNTKDSLRIVSKMVGFEYDDAWNTNSFAVRLMKFVDENGNKVINDNPRPEPEFVVNSVFSWCDNLAVFDVYLSMLQEELTDELLMQKADEWNRMGVVYLMGRSGGEAEVRITGCGVVASVMKNAMVELSSLKQRFSDVRIYFSSDFNVYNSNKSTGEMLPSLAYALGKHFLASGSCCEWTCPTTALVCLHFDSGNFRAFTIGEDGNIASSPDLADEEVPALIEYLNIR